MWSFKRKNGKAHEGNTAVAEPPTTAPDPAPRPDYAGTTEELSAEIERLSAENRAQRSADTERRLIELRHQLGVRRLETNGSTPQHPSPDVARLPTVETGLPEIDAKDVTPGLLRAGILRDGCLLVRGLIPRDEATRFAAQIDRSFDERERHDTGGEAADGFYDEFSPLPGSGEAIAREWIKMGGGVLAADSPRLTFEMMELFEAAGLRELVHEYLGEPPLISAQKTTLRKAAPSVPGAWHQDGAFMGEVRALNLWLSLSRCGDLAPGLDVVPRRLDAHVKAQTDEAMLDYQVSQRGAEEAAGDKPIIRPIFEPGDALFFDELFLHKTGSDPSMPNPRFALENWFFGGSAFPSEYAPLAV
jgi:ribosomal protein L29